MSTEAMQIEQLPISAELDKYACQCHEMLSTAGKRAEQSMGASTQLCLVTEKWV